MMKKITEEFIWPWASKISLARNIFDSIFLLSSSVSLSFSLFRSLPPFFPSLHFFPRFLPPRDITIGPDNWLRLCFIACSSLFIRLAAFIFHSFFVCRIEFYGRFDLHAAITPYHCCPAIFFSFYNDLLTIFSFLFFSFLFFAKRFWLFRSLNWKEQKWSF